MRPFTVVLGVLLGSLFSVSFSLSVVLLIFWILRNDAPRFTEELPELVRSTLIFAMLTVTAAFGFVGTIRDRAWRYACLVILWAGLLGTAFYYWPA
jgi:TctA family transporter